MKDKPTPKAHDRNTDPISKVEWVHRDTLMANDYNPNSQADSELDLLLTSLLEDGYTQPLVTDDEDNIVDGFHRWMLSDHPKMIEKYGGFVPRVVLIGKSKESKMMSTIRHNRARGTHGVLPMSDIVLFMVKSGLTVAQIMKGLGMEKGEVIRLSMRGGVAANEIADTGGWSEAWVPKFEQK